MDLEHILDVYEEKHANGKSTIKDDIDFHLALLKAAKNKVIEEMSPLVVDVFSPHASGRCFGHSSQSRTNYAGASVALSKRCGNMISLQHVWQCMTILDYKISRFKL